MAIGGANDYFSLFLFFIFLFFSEGYPHGTNMRPRADRCADEVERKRQGSAEKLQSSGSVKKVPTNRSRAV